MSYEEFKQKYTEAFCLMCKYKPDEVGSVFYAEILAELSDAHPDFESQLEAEAA